MINTQTNFCQVLAGIAVPRRRSDRSLRDNNIRFERGERFTQNLTN
ncbi:hypothetical protein M595_6024 [Lyngbya aestuarii BL J]|uniref:Uncharacterized protein n=1 Tax=Lyngbya aestuarii BL J TaxID=1348334 RepID=U7QBD1_9CYAN|nr:hypothetical protein M595_6024 [Lyngbya aestuarii BL J]